MSKGNMAYRDIMNDKSEFSHTQPKLVLGRR